MCAFPYSFCIVSSTGRIYGNEYFHLVIYEFCVLYRVLPESQKLKYTETWWLYYRLDMIMKMKMKISHNWVLLLPSGVQKLSRALAAPGIRKHMNYVWPWYYTLYTPTLIPHTYSKRAYRKNLILLYIFHYYHNAFQSHPPTLSLLYVSAVELQSFSFPSTFPHMWRK